MIPSFQHVAVFGAAPGLQIEVLQRRWSVEGLIGHISICLV